MNAVPASAQSTAPVIESAELRLWPEYDDPGVLVIFSGQFAEGATFPLQASFPVPAGARNIQATYQDAAGTLINRPFEVEDGMLNYELPSGAFHLEYYVDRVPSGDQRDIAYEFQAPYAIDALRVAVQQPARSTGFALSPAAEGTESGTDGLTYYVLARRNLAAGEKLPLEVKYSKTDTGLTAPALAVAPTGAAQQPAAAAPAAVVTNSSSWLPWLLIGLGIVLLAAVLAYWLLSQRRAAADEPAIAAASPARPRPASTRPASPARPAAGAPASGEAVSFCTNCGHALKPEDRFCSQCGAPRRS